MAAQLIIRDADLNPGRLPHERLFRFAIFVNGATPVKVFDLSRAVFYPAPASASDLISEAAALMLPPSIVSLLQSDAKYGHLFTNQRFQVLSSLNHEWPDEEDVPQDHMKTFYRLLSLQTASLANGRIFVKDEQYGITRHDAAFDGPLIDIPTICTRSAFETNAHTGPALAGLCAKSCGKEYVHHSDHNFPRHPTDVRQIARLIREAAASTR